MALATVKAQLSALVEEIVRTHEEVTITRNGEPVAVILSVEELESIQETLALLADPQARARLDEARAEIGRGEYTAREDMAHLMEDRRRREAATA